MKTVLTVKDLCERWGVDARTIARYEEEGIIRRLSGMPGVRFSISSIEKIEYDGTDTLLMKKDRIIKEQSLKIIELEGKLKTIREVAT